MSELKDLEKDLDGMVTYDYLVNHVADCESDMDFIISNLRKVDSTGQFLSSSARFLASIDREAFYPWISLLIEGAIEKDKERRYIWSLLKSVWGNDYDERVDELKKSDDNFRKIYKRIHPETEGSLI